MEDKFLEKAEQLAPLIASKFFKYIGEILPELPQDQYSYPNMWALIELVLGKIFIHHVNAMIEHFPDEDKEDRITELISYLKFCAITHVLKEQVATGEDIFNRFNNLRYPIN